MPDRVAIVGLGGGMNDAPRDRPRWGLPWGGDSGLDLYFEMHGPDNPKFTPEYYAKLRSLDAPVVTLERHSLLPDCLGYPEGAKAMAGGYLENSIAYMLAYAAFRGVRDIEVHGVGAPFDAEHEYQRANIEYMIGLCRGRGISVGINPKSELLKSLFQSGSYGADAGFLEVA